MKNKPLIVYDRSVTEKWDFEKRANYQGDIIDIIRVTEMRGKPFTIEYVDDDLNVINTLEYEGNEAVALEYETRMDKLLKGELPE